jgi:hypothetical protein
MKKSKTAPNRVAPGNKVWDPSDNSHVARQTPLDTKRKELAETRSLEEPRDRARSKETQQIRRKN